MRCWLPGGVWIEGRLRRDAVLCPITGRLEQDVAEQWEAAAHWPELVSCVLLRALEQLGGQPATPALVDGLSVADRQYLLLQLVIALEGDLVWTSYACGACRASFDLPLQRSALPWKPAGAGYPFADLTLGSRRMRLRVPSGADQHAIVACRSAEAVGLLLQRCLLGVDGGDVPAGFVAGLDDASIQCIEAALDQAAPALGEVLQTRCPECGRAQQLRVEPFAREPGSGHALSLEVHVIARHYHWGESEILALPRPRRQRYLALIDSERGVSS